MAPLHWAPDGGYTATVTALLGHGADPSAKTHDGETAHDRATGTVAADAALMARLKPVLTIDDTATVLQMRLALGLDARAQWQSAGQKGPKRAKKGQKGLDAAKPFAVPAGTPDHAEIATEFSKTLPFFAIDTIERVENGYQHEQFSVHAKGIAAKYGAGFDTGSMRRLLFHGTDAIEPIVNDVVSGFKPLLSGTVTGAIHGDGTYFARDAKYSDHYARQLPSGQKQMLLVDVVVGRWAKGAPELKMGRRRRSESGSTGAGGATTRLTASRAQRPRWAHRRSGMQRTASIRRWVCLGTRERR